MKDPDIQPCLNEFSHLIKKDYSMYSVMNTILEKLNTLDINNYKNELTECLKSFFACWEKLFLSTRTSATALAEKIGIEHPPTGHLSRTITNPLYSDKAMENVKKAEDYVRKNIKPNVYPNKEFLIELNKIITKDLEFHAQNGKSYASEYYSGIIEQSSNDTLLLKPEKKLVEKNLDSFFAWFQRNYNKDDFFLFCAQSYKKLLGVSPFYDGNGRTIRAFIDALLYSKGYRFKQYPSNYAEVRSMQSNDLKTLFEENCEKISD